MQAVRMTRQEYVQMAVDSGVAPLELRFTPIVGCDSGFPIAYRTKTLIHSILLGDMPEDTYTYVSDVRPCGVELLKHNIQHVITALRAFDTAGRNVAYLSVRCPSELTESVSLYDVIADVLRKNPSLDPHRLCLEFPASLLERDGEKARTAILDMKLLKVRTALVGCGAEDFPIAKLLKVPTDTVILDPEATEWAGSRNKPQLLPALIAYIKSMYIDVVAAGTAEQRKAMRRIECDGFIETDGECLDLSLDEAIAQKEES